MPAALIVGLVAGPVTFLAPLALLGLVALPLIWWLLRVTPPSPKKQIFPPLRILQDVMTEEETPDSTPLWLLLFRLLLVSIIAVALARPILFQAEGVTDRPVAIIIDDGWDAASNWNVAMREAEAQARLAQAEKTAVEQGLIEPQVDDRGVVAISAPASAEVKRSSNNEVTISSAAQEQTQAPEPRQPVRQAEIKLRTAPQTQSPASRISMVGEVAEPASRPARITVSRGGPRWSARPRTRNYPVRISLRRSSED